MKDEVIIPTSKYDKIYEQNKFISEIYELAG